MISMVSAVKNEYDDASHFVECLRREIELVFETLRYVGDQYFDSEKTIPRPYDTQLAFILNELRGSATRAAELHFRCREIVRPFDEAAVVDFVLAVESRDLPQLRRASEILDAKLNGFRASLPICDESAVTAKELAEHAGVSDRRIRGMIQESLGDSGPHIISKGIGRNPDRFVYWRVIQGLRNLKNSRVSNCTWPERKANLCCRK